MFKESIFFKVWLFFVNIFNRYETSVFYNLYIKAFDALKKIYNRSVFSEFFREESTICKKYETSIFYNLKENSIKKTVALFKYVSDSYVAEKIRTSFWGNYLKFENLLMFFIAVMIVTPHTFWNNLYGVMGAVVLMAEFFMKILNENREIKFTQSVFLVVFIIATVMAVFISPSMMSGIRVALFIFASVAFMVNVSDGINSENALKKLIYILITTFSIACFYGIFQGITNISADSMFTDIANNKGMPGRITAMFENPNNFAELIVLLAPLSLAMFLASNKKIVKALMLLAFFVNVVALLMTYSRGSYISLAISIVIFVLMYDYRLILPLLVVGIFALPFVPASVMNRIMTIGSRSDTSTAFRIYLWDGVIKLLRAEGLTGVGLGPEAFQTAYAPFASRFAANAPHSHMLYLELFVEMGILGGVSFFAFMISALRKGFVAFKKTDKFLKCTIIATVSSFIGIAFSAATEYIWFYPRVMFMFWVLLGILLCSVRLSKSHK